MDTTQLAEEAKQALTCLRTYAPQCEATIGNLAEAIAAYDAQQAQCIAPEPYTVISCTQQDGRVVWSIKRGWELIADVTDHIDAINLARLLNDGGAA